jgi:hypothetical protein
MPLWQKFLICAVMTLSILVILACVAFAYILYQVVFTL